MRRCACPTLRQPRDLLYRQLTNWSFTQVRCLAAVLLMVGRGEENPDVVRALLDVDTSPAKPQYPMAPEVRTVGRRRET